MSSEQKTPVILQILPRLETGGVERGTLEIASALNGKDGGSPSLPGTELAESLSITSSTTTSTTTTTNGNKPKESTSSSAQTGSTDKKNTSAETKSEKKDKPAHNPFGYTSPLIEDD